MYANPVGLIWGVGRGLKVNLNPIQRVLLEYFLDDQVRWLPVYLDIFETKTNVGGEMGLEVYYYCSYIRSCGWEIDIRNSQNYMRVVAVGRMWSDYLA